MSKLLSYLPALISFLTWLLGTFKASQANVLAVSGAFSSPAEGASTVAFWSNVETGGMIATALASGIAWVINRFWGKVSSGKLQPHVQYQAAMGGKLVVQKYVAGKPEAVALLESLDPLMADVFKDALKASETAVVVEAK